MHMLLLTILATALITITWLSILSLYITRETTKNEDLKLAVGMKKLAYKRESQIDLKTYLNLAAMRGGQGIIIANGNGPAELEDLPPELKAMIAGSPDHDEIQEIDPSDNLIGVFFDSKYPPEFSDSQD